MTTAFCGALRRNPCPTYPELLQGMLAEMRRKGYSQRPQLSSTQRFDMDRPFLLQDIVPNQNAKVGRTFRRKFPPQPKPMDPVLGELLGLAGAVVIGAAVDTAAEAAIGALGGMLLRAAFGGGRDD